MLHIDVSCKINEDGYSWLYTRSDCFSIDDLANFDELSSSIAAFYEKDLESIKERLEMEEGRFGPGTFIEVKEISSGNKIECELTAGWGLMGIFYKGKAIGHPVHYQEEPIELTYKEIKKLLPEGYELISVDF
jgi:hypothetical protein